MKIEFAVTLSVADALVIPVQKNGIDTAIGGRVGQEILAAAAAAARFEGEAGSVAEAFVGADGAVSRILLLGIGDGIRHRGGFTWAVGADMPIGRRGPTQFFVGFDALASVFPDPRGPSWYFGGGGWVGINYAL